MTNAPVALMRYATPRLPSPTASSPLRRTASLAGVGLGLMGLLASMGACNDTPVANLEKSFTLKVTKDTGDGEPIKIDFLWVIDNSSSMCQEQQALAANFRTFVDQIRTAFDIDPRIAVTTVDAQCDVNNTTIFSSKGKFNQRPARAFPPPCQVNERVECLSDNDCSGIDCEVYGSCQNQGEWACRTTPSASCVTNPNGSINTTCRRRCTGDAECKTLFGDDKYVCQKPSANQADWGCIRPPDSADTAVCPDELPPFLDGNNLDLFPCIATVGVNQEKCLKFEQTLRSGYMALDKNGLNSEQAKGFLRDDAYLVVVFVSDEEDCSVADTATVSEESYETCGLLKTTDEGGPLVPVAHYVNKFKALKSDPGKVIVAAIGGDSLKSDPAEIALDRSAYIQSKGDPKTCYHQTSICSSVNGTADFGSRFLSLTKSFGPNGSFANICGDNGIEVALQQIARTIVTVVNKVCLPRQVLGGLSVVRTRNGVQTTLVEGDGPGTYKLVFPEECARGDELYPALAFGDAPIPGESIEITYQGDPQFQ
ncbi:MAG: hypothetical protein JNJ59_11445 [Deltaproteobacteria bacterium]|nr:hypothetical protein [Deltaproteobacteria bacterium]